MLDHGRHKEFAKIGPVSRDQHPDKQEAGITSIEETTRDGAGWKVIERGIGDQISQGRQLTLDAHRVSKYPLRLYAAR